eukprot:SAG31_NODE_17060_length_685_cov_0.568259_1_plen_142_part_01
MNSEQCDEMEDESEDDLSEEYGSADGGDGGQMPNVLDTRQSPLSPLPLARSLGVSTDAVNQMKPDRTTVLLAQLLGPSILPADGAAAADLVASGVVDAPLASTHSSSTVPAPKTGSPRTTLQGLTEDEAMFMVQKTRVMRQY